jgi:cysteinyl-tRNA synthetase|tara:strand:+ start:6307 stop:7746 length:1440 start_codon:yes stop_codon:yes gene_type:complete
MKRLHLHDTLSRNRCEIFPEDGEKFRFYCCGPTVYGPAHIGNFRAFLVQDLFRRVIELSGIKTLHVRNITDVDDKTIREAQNSELSLVEFTAGWTELFHEDAKQLNMLDPHLEPSAVQHIPEQIQLIEKLIEKGNAYASEDGSVYFSVKSYSNYGKLTRIDQRDLMAGAGETANDADEYEKDHVCDFVLWKARKPEDGDNYWDSPWGSGRPGWHLECSAMGMKYLGETFDLHAGGVDLCFPHHENEIAQSEASTGKEFARHWFHNEHLMVDGSKMSKSLGNLYTLADIHDRDFSAAELRYSLLSGSYRTKINFSFDRMNEARINLKRIANLVQNLDSDLPSYEELCERATSESMDLGPFESSWDALLEDLNAPAALGELFVAIKPLEKELAEGNVPEDTKKVALHGLALLVHAFGWILPELEPEQSSPDVPDHVKDLAERRWIAKQEKDWAESDRLRDAVIDEGWVIKDSKDGYELELS